MKQQCHCIVFQSSAKNPPTRPETYTAFIAAYLQYAATLFCMLPWKSWKIPWNIFSDDTDWIANKLGIFCALTPVSDPPSKLQIPTSFAGSQKNNFRGFYTLLSTFNQDFSLLVNDPSLAFCFQPAKFLVLSAASKESCFFATSFLSEFHWPMVNGWWSLTGSFFSHSLQKIQRPQMVFTDLQCIGWS